MAYPKNLLIPGEEVVLDLRPHWWFLTPRALLSVVAIPELMHRSAVIVSETFRPLETYTAVAAMYFVLLYPLVALSRRLEMKWE